MACRIDRRSFLGKSILAGAAAMGVQSLEEKKLLAALENPTDPKKLRSGPGQGNFPTGKIKDVQLSRVIAGGNIISGWCHQRDLLYVSTLAGHYLTEEKQFDTLELCEEHGINTCSPDPTQLDFINKYKQHRGGDIQTVVGVRQDWEHFSKPFWDGDGGLKEWIDMSIDKGSTIIYTQGGYTEHCLKTGKQENYDLIAKAIGYIQQQGIPAGIGTHDIKSIEIAEEQNMNPDYYMKSFHHDRYWSAHPRENREHWSVDAGASPDHDRYHDNMYDLFPDKTEALMADIKKPWIAYKTLAAGAIDPQSAFEFCLKGGADFLAVGMFDFQVVEDTLIAKKILSDEKIMSERKRPWCA